MVSGILLYLNCAYRYIYQWKEQMSEVGDRTLDGILIRTSVLNEGNALPLFNLNIII